MSTDFRKSFKRVGGVALASVLMASCSQDWSYSEALTGYDEQSNPYAKGKARMAAGRYGLAIQSFRKALATDPGSVKALNGLAATYDLLGRFDLAERYYRQALSLDPASVQSLNNLGYSYYLRGDYGQARQLFERAAAVDAKNPVVVANLSTLEKATTSRQVAAAAKPRGRADEDKNGKAAPRTTWIERSDRKIQTLVTRPAPAMVKAARESKVEPRVVHSPKPLINIETAAPAKGVTVKPAATPNRVVAAVETKPVSTNVELEAAVSAPPKVSKSKQAESPARPATPLITEVPAKRNDIMPNAGVSRRDVVTLEPVEVAEVEATANSERVSAAKPPTPAATSTGGAEDATAGLPKLNDDVARDVLAATAAAATETGASAPVQATAPVLPFLDTSPTAVKVPERAEQQVDVAALDVNTGAAVPPSEDPGPADITPVEPVAPEAVKAPNAVEPEPEPELETAALVTKIETPGAMSKPEKPAVKEAAHAAAALKMAGRIEISNGAGRLNMAARMGQFLNGHGMRDFTLTNARSFTNKVSVLYFKPGYIANAKSISGLLPVQPHLRANGALQTDFRLVLGGDLLKFDRNLIAKFK